jgi:hypothetical protein
LTVGDAARAELAEFTALLSVQDGRGIAMPSSNSTTDTVLGVWETAAAEIGGILDLGMPPGAGTDGTVVTSIDP